MRALEEVSHVEHGDSQPEASVDDYAPGDEKVAHQLEDPEWIAAQRRYLRKLDLKILPMVSLLYFFEYLDRANVSNVRLYGYNKGKDTPSDGIGPGKKSLSPSLWQMVVMIFYWIAFGVCGWSITSMLQTTASNLSGALACRVFIGAFEGLFGTGIVYYLSLWYHRTEMGLRVFWFLGPTSIAGAFGGLIAFKRKHVIWTITDWKLYAQTAIYLPTAALLSSISGFLPATISIPPYAAAFALMFIVSYSSDHFKERGRHIAALIVVFAIAYALLATLPEPQLRGKYACVCIAVACVYATYPPSHAWVVNSFGNETKRAIGIGLYTAIGNLGSLANPVPGATVDVTELADRSPQFRFMT
ncbi:putative transporter [Tolypocladium ophioglossoides CBS 100239]|uniref:Putative transporter n=1 Tax=Tolypocladium ophioglossoides (strain CBS 100239) TaxID=1163406 RepID=A0A0L0NDC4_TOLOC|nr:putative transporter [Tolypocladium ophioglossoides CBS 100239]